MRDVSNRQVQVLASLAVVVTMFLGFAAVLTIHLHLLCASVPLTVCLACAVCLLEAVATPLPALGYATLAPVGVFALGAAQGPQSAILVAFAATLGRELICRRGGIVARTASLSLSFLPVAAAVVVFWLIAGIPNPTRLLEPAQWVAMVSATAAFALVDLAVSAACVTVLAAEKRRIWRAVRKRLRVLDTALVPLGWGGALLMRLGGTPGVTDGYNLWTLGVVALPLVASHLSLRALIDEAARRSTDGLDDPLTRVKEELGEVKTQNRALMADLHKRIDEIAILRDMGQQLGASKDLSKTLDIVIQMIRKLLIYQSCVIFLIDEAGRLRPTACVSVHREALEKYGLREVEESLLGLVTESKKPVLVADLPGTSEFRVLHDERSVVCVPLIVKDSIIGVIYVGTLRPGTYTDDHVHMLETLANPAAIAIQSAQVHGVQQERLAQEMELKKLHQEQAAQFSGFFNLGSDLNRAVKRDEIFDILLEHLALLVSFQSCIVFQYEEKDRQLVARKSSSPYSALFTNFAVDLDESSAEGENVLLWVARNKEKLLLADIASEPRFTGVIQRERSVIVVPLLAEDKVIGEIYVGSADPGAFDDATLNICSMVCSQTALALQKALLFEKTEGLAITDGVTGLYTHRYFQERLSQAVKTAERYGRPLALVMVDTDHFKKFNDTLGHPAGDQLLKEISALLRSYTRESDLVCRYGGDEFSLILQDTDKESAMKMGERIRDAFQLRFGELAVKVTSSIGVAAFPADASSKAALVAAADTALYRSKQGGRNRVSGAHPLERSQPAGH